jgi:predicted membrane-bound spermidine synthase
MSQPLFVAFLSGAAALLYQVIWQRLLVIFLGGDVYSVTVIVAAFMGGLGFGSLIGGIAADRLGPARSLWAFAAVELAIALCGAVSKPLFYDVLYLRFPHLSALPGASLVVFAMLLVPTLPMGLSLPLLARGVTASLDVAGRVVGSLYGWNTLGAASGAFAAPWLLVPAMGLERSLGVAAAINAVCALLAIVLVVSSARARARATPVSALPAAAGSGVQPAARDARALAEKQKSASLPFALWVVLYGLSGFIALGLEVAWFRVLGVIVKSTAFTFGTLLALYLGGLGAGAAIGARLVARSSRPALLFLAFQYGVTLYAAMSLILVVVVLAAGRPVKLVRYLAGYDPADVYGTLARARELASGTFDALGPLSELVVLYLVVPAVLIGPATVLMGMSFPFLQKAVHSDFPRLGRRLGTLLAGNILGAVLGAVSVGWLLLPAWGTAGTLRALVASGAVFSVSLAWCLREGTFHEHRRNRALPRREQPVRPEPVGGERHVTAGCSDGPVQRDPAHGFRESWQRPLRTFSPPTVAVMGAALTAAVVAAMPRGADLWARLHGAEPGMVLFDEDGAGLSLLKITRTGGSGGAEVYVNGLGQSWVPYGNVHTVLGALPVLVHPAPGEVLVIGLGSGDTAFAAAARKETTRVVAVEIVGAQRRTLERFAARHGYPALVSLLRDPRVEHLVGDGRAFIQQRGRRFDVIEADALRPSSASAGMLYSREYFDLVRRHLRPGGLAVTWTPTERTRATFLQVFPHVLSFNDEIAIGSADPIPFDPVAVLERAQAARSYFAVAGVDIVAMLRHYLDPGPVRFGPSEPRPDVEPNTDMFPRDEFALPFWPPF